MKKTVIITGGTRGIGRACAELFAKQDYNVVITYIHSDNHANELSNQLGITAIKADVRIKSEIEAMVTAVIKKHGNIDVLVNNAGIAEQKMFCDITPADWDNMMAVNVTGVYNSCSAVVPHMVQNKYGKIINISSIWGNDGASCEVHYSTSKAAVIGFTKALSKELGLSNINVNCICPGVVLTDMNSMLDTKTLAELKAETSLNRLGKPDDIAELALFLASDKASFITGQVITADGGR